MDERERRVFTYYYKGDYELEKKKNIGNKIFINFSEHELGTLRSYKTKKKT